MNSNTQPNLDRLAAQHAQAIIRRLVDEDKNGNKRTDGKEIEKAAGSADNTVTKAVGVLQENGVYACFLYLLAREKENGGVVVEEMLNLLDGLGFGWGRPTKNGQIDTTAEAVLPHISDKVTVDLERLLLAKETLEQMLIYARYGAKARS
ncbi:MAG: ferritin-like protein [Ardenticatenaceae bacterium]|nr:ferritin-like protein [Ardenticatenaceae bacterium]